jgi:hypothetical protein
MVGYCLKYTWKENFKVVNVIDVKKNASIDEYTKFGATSTKDCVTFFGFNIIDSAFVWCKYWMKKQIRSFLLFVLMNMIQFSQFYQGVLWVVLGKEVKILVKHIQFENAW